MCLLCYFPNIDIATIKIKMNEIILLNKIKGVIKQQNKAIFKSVSFISKGKL